VLKIEMHFLPDVYVPCDVCHGKRYNRETLDILYKGQNISEVLEMTVEHAYDFFKAVPVVARKLKTLLDVGLGYIRLGQSATTLSGGEAQRVKLSLELSKRDTGRTLYILDEPTTGLHFHDIALLLEVIHRLRDQGNTVVIIEHNLDVIKTADWVIDLGPEGGAGGGQIIAQGTPEQVAKSKASFTGRYLAPLLQRDKEAGATVHEAETDEEEAEATVGDAEAAENEKTAVKPARPKKAVAADAPKPASKSTAKPAAGEAKAAAKTAKAGKPSVKT
jgi:excinuclease ABC subunit A